MPSDKALVQVEVGTATVVMDGTLYQLATGDDIYVGRERQRDGGSRSRARMTYRGGALVTALRRHEARGRAAASAAGGRWRRPPRSSCSPG